MSLRFIFSIASRACSPVSFSPLRAISTAWRRFPSRSCTSFFLGAFFTGADFLTLAFFLGMSPNWVSISETSREEIILASSSPISFHTVSYAASLLILAQWRGFIRNPGLIFFFAGHFGLAGAAEIAIPGGGGKPRPGPMPGGGGIPPGGAGIPAIPGGGGIPPGGGEMPAPPGAGGIPAVPGGGGMPTTPGGGGMPSTPGGAGIPPIPGGGGMPPTPGGGGIPTGAATRAAASCSSRVCIWAWSRFSSEFFHFISSCSCRSSFSPNVL
mmetsp:Transcript_26352/g.41692  ORF Transcript_26352/g.41692 Transcript_26352/m.41692 type:complete len:269 (+) Transcript_26352:1342-2148(+)